MGQEIGKVQFADSEFEEFRRRLQTETELLGRLVRDNLCSSAGPITGFEIETWLVDAAMAPAPANAEFLAALNSGLVCPELAKFNVEFNNEPRSIQGTVLSDLEADLANTWALGSHSAESLGLELLAIGILPTVSKAVLNLDNMSLMNRFRALNEQVFLARRQRPLKLEICGHEHLQCLHADVMLEAAATSFQIHLQVPLTQVREYYNAAIVASAPLIGVGSNSPFLFGKDLWAETRIPLFEQAIDIGGYQDAARGPMRRVSFGTGYSHHTIAEPFHENLLHFPVLLPLVSDSTAGRFDHLRLHNGTIWRWNRALVGFDPDGTPHVRIEHRVLPAGPSMVDMIANAAFFYGLVEYFVREQWEKDLPFAVARDNFYQAARLGLAAPMIDRRGDKHRLGAWVLETLLPLAESELRRLGLAEADIDRYLGTIERRTASGQTGSEWQRHFIGLHPLAFADLTREYFYRQRTGEPVHQWPL